MPLSTCAKLTVVGFRTQWRGQRDTPSRRRLWKLLGLSLVLHAPLTPLGALIGLVGLLSRSPAEPQGPVEPLKTIPIDLVEEPGTAPAPAAAPPAAPPQPKAKSAIDNPFKDLPHEPDEPTAEIVAPPKPKPKPKPTDAGVAATDGGAGKGIGDPVALSGAAGRVADDNANVRLIVFTDRIRGTVLGSRVGALLAAANQWHDFFGPSGLDPIKDFDRILIAGPQLRDSSAVVAVLRYNTSETKVRAAIGALVDRDKRGGWLDAGVPAARASADRAERVFVLPAPHIIVVAPQSAAKAALALPRSTRFPSPKGNEVLTAYVRTPWRAFIGIPFDIPKTIKWVRLSIAPTPSGGAAATIDAEDASPDAAKQDAASLTRAINAVTQVNVLFIKQRFIEPVDLQADGSHIKGVVTATASQLHDAIGMVAGLAQEIAAENAERAAQAAKAVEPGVPADAGTPAAASEGAYDASSAPPVDAATSAALDAARRD